MSPNGIVGPSDQGSQNQGKVSIGQTPNAAKFRCDLDKKCARYLLSKIYAPGKLEKKFIKSLNICYAPMVLSVQNFTALGQTMYEKSITKIF